jgi:hypothetical protein
LVDSKKPFFCLINQFSVMLVAALHKMQTCVLLMAFCFRSCCRQSACH